MFSSASRDQEGTEPNSVESSAKVNRFRMLICAALGALVVLGCIGGAIWYNSGSPVVPESVTNPPHNAGGSVVMGTGGGLEVGGGNSGGVESAGTSAGSQRVSSVPQSSSSSRRLMTAAKANFKLIVAVFIGVFVLLAAIVALVVYLSTSNQELVDVTVRIEDVDDPLNGGNGEVIKEEDEAVPVLPITLAVVAVLLVGLGLRRLLSPIHESVPQPGGGEGTETSEEARKPIPPPLPIVAGADAKERIEEPAGVKELRVVSEPTPFMKLQAFREIMVPEMQCSRSKNGRVPSGKNISVSICDGRTSMYVFCPPGFTPNSVWWAFEDELDKKNCLVAVRNDDLILVQAKPKADLDSQYLPLENIPGHGDIPHRPQARDVGDISIALRKDYVKWREWAILDEKCVLQTSDSLKSNRVSVCIQDSEKNEDFLSIYCETENPSIKSVYSALLRANKLVEDKPFDVTPIIANEFLAKPLSEVNPDIQESRESIWRMYEPYKPLNG